MLFLEHPITGSVIPLAQILFNILEEINFSMSQLCNLFLNSFSSYLSLHV